MARRQEAEAKAEAQAKAKAEAAAKAKAAEPASGLGERTLQAFRQLNQAHRPLVFRVLSFTRPQQAEAHRQEAFNALPALERGAGITISPLISALKGSIEEVRPSCCTASA